MGAVEQEERQKKQKELRAAQVARFKAAAIRAEQRAYAAEARRRQEAEMRLLETCAQNSIHTYEMTNAQWPMSTSQWTTGNQTPSAPSIYIVNATGHPVVIQKRREA